LSICLIANPFDYDLFFLNLLFLVFFISNGELAVLPVTPASPFVVYPLIYELSAPVLEVVAVVIVF
jgi:hypothetical protein